MAKELELIAKFLEGARASAGEMERRNYELFSNISTGLAFEEDPLNLTNADRIFARVQGGGMIDEQSIERIVYTLSKEGRTQDLEAVGEIFEGYEDLNGTLKAAAEIYSRIGNNAKQKLARERIVIRGLKRVEEILTRLKLGVEEGDLVRLRAQMSEMAGLSHQVDSPYALRVIRYAGIKAGELGEEQIARRNYKGAFEILRAAGRTSIIEDKLLPAVMGVRGYALVAKITDWLSEVKRD